MDRSRLALIVAAAVIGGESAGFARAARPVSSPVAADPQARAQRASADDRLAPALTDALARVVAAEDAMFDAGLLRPVVDGDTLEKALPLFDEILAALPEAAQDALREETRDFGLLVRMHLHHVGHRAFDRAFAEDDDLAPADLAPLFDPAFLRGEPAAPGSAWKQFKSDLERMPPEQADGVVSRVGNATGRYLLWGAMQHARFWSERAEPEEREAFIARMIAEGLPDAAARWVVVSALEPPLLQDDAEPADDAGDTDVLAAPRIRTIAGPLDDLRGKVGFAKTHLEQLDAILDAVLDDRLRGARVDEEMVQAAARLRLFVAWEVLPRPGPAQLGRDGSPEEALAYWKWRIERGGWASAWQEFRDYLGEVARGVAGSPLDTRIAELEVRLAEGTLDAEGRATLQELRGQRIADQRLLASSIATLILGAAPVELARAELLELPGVLRAAASGFDAEMLLVRLLEQAWRDVTFRDAAGASAALESLKGTEGAAQIPDAARTGIVMGLQMAVVSGQASPEVMQAFKELAITADATTRGNALIQTGAMSSADAEQVFEAALADLQVLDPGKSQGDVLRLRAGFVYGLQARVRGGTVDPWLRRLVARSFGNDESASLWSDSMRTENEATLALLVNTLSDEDFDRLVAAGRIPEAMAKLRD